ncbi:hypothetical protein B0H19DRAFT_1029363 [Mycena capillaripes]|nr:hypothetical protein B0H19DRAFT_1029363 [Mycena capillaripes]
MCRLSALLAEATSDPMYLHAANQSAEFIRSHLYNLRGVVQPFMSTNVDDANSTVASTRARRG